MVKLGLLPDRLHIRQLQILPEFHNGGIGSKVVTLVKQKASERLLPVTLNVLLKTLLSAYTIVRIYCRRAE